jgi:cholesterol transport system auxiliary component
VKILNDRNGEVRAQRVFSANVPVSGTGNPGFIAALDAAFARVTTDMVAWTLKSI